MITVDQTTFGVPHGNCFSACVASILELPLSEVPYFMGRAADCSAEGCGLENWSCGCWWPQFLNWCRERCYDCLYFKVSDLPDGGPPGYSIMGGPNNTRGSGHAVVGLDGVMVHDPNPNRGGLREVEDYFVLERLSVQRAFELYAVIVRIAAR